MTLCIAAICKHEGTPAIVLCTDCRTEKGLASYSEGRIGSNDAEKIRRMGKDFAALVAGGPTNADELLAKCDEAVFKFERSVANQDSDIIVTDFFGDLRKAARLRRLEIVDHYIAMHTVFSGREEFLSRGQQVLPHAEYSMLSHEISRIHLGADVIIAGFHGGEAVVARLDCLGDVHWEDNYSVIGTGTDIALALLCQNNYDEDMTLYDCLFRVFEAKAAAQKNRTVGPVTAFEILVQGAGRFDISNKFFKLLKDKRRTLKLPEIDPPAGWLVPDEEDEEVNNAKGAKDEETIDSLGIESVEGAQGDSPDEL